MSHLPSEEVHPNVLRVGWSANSTSMQLGKPVKALLFLILSLQMYGPSMVGLLDYKDSLISLVLMFQERKPSHLGMVALERLPQSASLKTTDSSLLQAMLSQLIW